MERKSIYTIERETLFTVLNECRGYWTLLKSFECPHKGKYNESLYVDVVYFGEIKEDKPVAEKIVVLIVGTHGVEGSIGSYAIRKVIRDGTLYSLFLEKKIGVLIIHALNPYGWSHGRRSDAENIDVNYNGIVEYKTYGDFWKYKDLLCPCESIDLEHIESMLGSTNHAEIFNAAIIGQYDDNKAIYYGGRKLSWSLLKLKEICESLLCDVSDVVCLDFHSGLPLPVCTPYMGNIICMADENDGDQIERVKNWFGFGIQLLYKPENNSIIRYERRDVLSAFERWLSKGVNTTSIVLEMGVYVNFLKLLAVTIWENSAWHYGSENDKTNSQKAFSEIFYPSEQRDEFHGAIVARTKWALFQISKAL